MRKESECPFLWYVAHALTTGRSTANTLRIGRMRLPTSITSRMYRLLPRNRFYTRTHPVESARYKYWTESLTRTRPTVLHYFSFPLSCTRERNRIMPHAATHVLGAINAHMPPRAPSTKLGFQGLAAKLDGFHACRCSMSIAP